jgi:hypothetical protein
MMKITLTPEAARMLRDSLNDFQVCDPEGNVLATVARDKTPEFIAELKRRAAASGPRCTSEQAGEMLRTLQEAWDREGPFDEGRARRIVQDLSAKWDR